MREADVMGDTTFWAMSNRTGSQQKGVSIIMLFLFDLTQLHMRYFNFPLVDHPFGPFIRVDFEAFNWKTQIKVFSCKKSPLVTNGGE